MNWHIHCVLLSIVYWIHLIEGNVAVELFLRYEQLASMKWIVKLGSIQVDPKVNGSNGLPNSVYCIDAGSIVHEFTGVKQKCNTTHGPDVLNNKRVVSIVELLATADALFIACFVPFCVRVSIIDCSVFIDHSSPYSLTVFIESFPSYQLVGGVDIASPVDAVDAIFSAASGRPL